MERLNLDKNELTRINIPPGYWRSKLSDIKDSRTEGIVERYLDSLDSMIKDCIGLFLSGNPSTCSTIGSLIAKEARSLKYRSYFAEVWEFRQHVKANKMFDSQSTVMDRCKDVDVLILDGITKDVVEDKWGVGIAELSNLVMFRGKRGRITIVTSPIPPKETNEGKLGDFRSYTKNYLVPVAVNGEEDVSDEKMKKVLGE